MKKHAADTIGATIISAALIASLSPMAAFGASSDNSAPSAKSQAERAEHDESSATPTEEPATSITVDSRIVSAKTVRAAVKKAASTAANVTKITLGSEATTVEKGAFKAYKKLSALTLGKNVSRVDTGAFEGSTALRTVTLKTKKLPGASLAKALRDSAITDVKVTASDDPATNARYVKRYQAYFTETNSESKISVENGSEKASAGA